jgi:hypothetical protein
MVLKSAVSSRGRIPLEFAESTREKVLAEIAPRVRASISEAANPAGNHPL